MATAGAGLEVEGVEKFDSLSQQIEESFIEYHNILDTHKVKLLERVKRMKELYVTHRDIEKAMKQMEMIRQATNDVVTENLVAVDKEHIVGLWDEKIKKLERDKDKLDYVCELKFVPNTEELIDCVKKIHLRDSLCVEYDKRRDPIVMKGRRGVGEGDMRYVRAIAVDKEMDLVYVTDWDKDIVNVYSTEGDFVRKIVSDKLCRPHAISLSDEFVFVSCSGRKNVVKLSKTGVYLSDSKTVNKDLSLTMCRNMCTYNNQTLYVSNESENRIEVFGLDLSYTGNFGEGEIGCPTDIKTHNDMIFVLDYIIGRIHTFSTEHIYLSSIQLIGYNYVPYREFLAVDKKGNFIVANRDDNYNSCLKVFSPSGELVDSLGAGYLFVPQGIGLDRQDRIISLSESPFNRFQVY